jgi:hypothetical protein
VTRYYVAERAGRLSGELFCTGDLLTMHGQPPSLDPAILREITEADWRERIAESKRRLAEMFPDAEVRA